MAEVRAFWEREGLPADPRSVMPGGHDVLLIHRVLHQHELQQARTAAGREPTPA
jgi:hypothetical protein